MKTHGTIRGKAWTIDGKLQRPGVLVRATDEGAREVSVRVITESEFQRLVKRALANDTYDLFQRRRKP